MTGEAGVQLTNFEHIVGSSHNDVIGLWQLNPGGKLSEAQEAAFKAAQELPVSFASGDPATIGAALDARVTAAAQIEQNQQDVLIEGGATSSSARAPARTASMAAMKSTSAAPLAPEYQATNMAPA